VCAVGSPVDASFSRIFCLAGRLGGEAVLVQALEEAIMKSIRWLLLGGAVAAAGCAHNAASPTEAQPEKTASVATPAPASTPSKSDEQALEDLQKMLAGEVLNFDFDRADLSAESRERLQRIAEILAKHPGLTVRIEGHCDERGGEEFNLQLGQMRAAAAKKYLGNLGIASARIDTISYGKTRPANPAHNEQAWTENRRANVIPNAKD
jgi:peptidoglycan-associated lipoprotein